MARTGTSLEWTFPSPATSKMLGYKEASTLVINGKSYSVPDNLPANFTLNEFIRKHAHLKGTKNMCLEGGCGSCIVTAKYRHPDTGRELEHAVNSCLVPVFACRGWKITTVEGIGNKTKGYNDIQARLAKGHGSQCGYCSAGMVMNMYSLMKVKPELTMKEIENSFGGNLCRCTGYRPILDTFKSFAKDAPKWLVDKCADIEDLMTICPVNKKPCVKNGSCNGESCVEDTEVVDVHDVSLSKVSLQDGNNWYHVSEKREIFEILDMCGDSDYMLVGGNTAHGVYRTKYPLSHYINLSNVAQLHSIVEAGGTIVLGANNSLTTTMDYFYSKSKQEPQQFGYLKELADHIDLIANVPIRNVGTLAGNLSIKNQHKEFPSDLFVMLETVGAAIVVEDVMEQESVMSPQQYRDFDMTKKLITKIIMPSIDSNHYVCRTFKITPRAQNAHAHVNAGFLFKVDKKDNFKVLERPNIVFGGINPGFVHASAAEQEAVGKKLLNADNLKAVLNKLQSELRPDNVKPDPSPEYRKGLACSLFYKFVLGLSPESLEVTLRSGGEDLIRPLSSGQQEISTDKTIWPVSKPIPKIEALAQCSGEAEYVNDFPNQPNEVYGAFVLATKGPCDSFTLDASEALSLPGVLALLTAKDIPGKNSFQNDSEPEVIFAEKKVLCAGTPLGAIIAETNTLAHQAAQLVKVTYQGVQNPEISVKKIVNSKDHSRLWQAATKEAGPVKPDVKHEIQGSHWFPSQYHFTMETQTCHCEPIEDGLNVNAATQCPGLLHDVIASVLNVPINSVNMSVRRCGGGYGAKLGKSGIATATCAVAAHVLQRPVRFVMTIEENMDIVGKRAGCLFNYLVGVDDNGVIQKMHIDYYQDDGATKNDSIAGYTLHYLTNIYDDTTWSINGYGVRTDIPSQTWCRSPGSTEAISAIETIMEHIARTLKKDPTEVKFANKRDGDSPIQALVDDLKRSADYEKRVRDIQQFNQTNRWKKRGISLVPMDYPFAYFGNYHSMVSVYGGDGTVSISHGCIEMGQGLNTKVAQVCAYILGIDVEDVSVKPYYSLIAPNVAPTGGSSGSESAAYATKIACEEIVKRLEPLKKENPTATWKELVAKAKANQINLNATYMFTPRDDVKNYHIYGVSAIEVEVDILTGQHQILRADILEDTGISLSPEVDVGQIEGAYVMGLALYTIEDLIYDDKTGKLLTNRTWNYKIPGAKDIPIDFRVEMRKNAPNPVGVLKSKATGEPPLCMSVGVVFALRRALESARADAGLPDDYFDIELPLTAEKLWMYSGTSVAGMHL